MQETPPLLFFKRCKITNRKVKEKKYALNAKNLTPSYTGGGGGLGPRTCMLSYYLYYPLKFFCSSVLFRRFRRFREFRLSMSGMIHHPFLPSMLSNAFALQCINWKNSTCSALAHTMMILYI